VLFPADDASLVTLSRNREELETRYRVVAQDWSVVRRLIEKRLTYELADRHGIPCPRISTTRDPAEALEFAREIGFPCLLKPSVGHEFFHRYQAKMLLIRDAVHLRAVLSDLADYGAELMLSEWIPGDDACGVNYNSFYMDGVAAAEFTAQKLRLHPTRIGFPVAVVSKRVPEVVELGRRMIAAFNYNGFSCMEFKRDVRDGIYKLMELNGRHNHSGLLDLACGVNFPYLSYLSALREAVPASRVQSPEGIYWLDEIKDIRGIVAASRNGGAGPRNFLRPYLRRHASAVGSLADPLPILHTLGDTFAALVGRQRRAPSAGRTSSP
jgi:predicted ATP-grasp superfamily ATP-dependent carboligase